MSVSTLSRIQGIVGKSTDCVSFSSKNNNNIVGPVVKNKVSFKKSRIEKQREKMELANKKIFVQENSRENKKEKAAPVQKSKHENKMYETTPIVLTERKTETKQDPCKKGTLRLKIKNNRIDKIVKTKKQVTSLTGVIRKDPEENLTVDEGMTVMCQNNDAVPEKVVTT